MPSVYIIGDDTPAPVKIGYTTKAPARRLATLITSTPRDLRVITTCRATRADETALHRHHRASRARREWFRRTQEIEAVISDLPGAIARARKAHPVVPAGKTKREPAGPLGLLIADRLDAWGGCTVADLIRRYNKRADERGCPRVSGQAVYHWYNGVRVPLGQSLGVLIEVLDLTDEEIGTVVRLPPLDASEAAA